MSEKEETTVLEFIKAYYNALSYDSNSIFKFYSNDSYIYRQNNGQKIGKKFEEMKDKLTPEIPKGSHISVTQYHSSIEDGITNIVVLGTIIFENKKEEFSQQFTLQFREYSTWIIADSLIISDANVYEQNKDLIEYKSNRAPK